MMLILILQMSALQLESSHLSKYPNEKASIPNQMSNSKQEPYCLPAKLFTQIFHNLLT